MESTTSWYNPRIAAISSSSTLSSRPPSLSPPHNLSFPFCPSPFRFVPNKSLTLHARKHNSEPELRPTIIQEVSEDDEDDDVIFEDEALLDNGDDVYYEDESVADEAELYDGDGGGGGGVALAGTWWDDNALEIAEEVV